MRGRAFVNAWRFDVWQRVGWRGSKRCRRGNGVTCSTRSRSVIPDVEDRGADGRLDFDPSAQLAAAVEVAGHELHFLEAGDFGRIEAVTLHQVQRQVALEFEANDF